MLPRAQILSLATAVPPHVIEQSDAAAFARDIFGERFPAFDRIAGVFINSGIRRRRSVKPMEWFLQPLGWRERTEAYLAGARNSLPRRHDGRLTRQGFLPRPLTQS